MLRAAQEKFRYFLLLFILSGSTFYGCKHQPIEPKDTGLNPVDTTGYTDTNGNNPQNCDPNIVYFENQILPILISNCTMKGTNTGCHNNQEQAEGIDLTNYVSIMKGKFDDGKYEEIVRPGNASNSDLYEALNEDDLDKRMPLGYPKLQAQEIALIKKWIDQGAKNLHCNDGRCNTSNITLGGQITEIIKINCKGCHSGNSPSGNINLTLYTGTGNIKGIKDLALDNNRLLKATNQEYTGILSYKICHRLAQNFQPEI